VCAALPNVFNSDQRLQGFDTVLSDMLQFTSGVNDVELSLELANTAMNVATGHFFELYGQPYAEQLGFTHTGFLKAGGNLVMKVYEVRGPINTGRLYDLAVVLPADLSNSKPAPGPVTIHQLPLQLTLERGFRHSRHLVAVDT